MAKLKFDVEVSASGNVRVEIDTDQIEKADSETWEDVAKEYAMDAASSGDVIGNYIKMERDIEFTIESVLPVPEVKL